MATSATVRLTNELKELKRLQSFLAEAASPLGIDERMLHRINLVCDELITNVVSYGYDKSEAGCRHIDVTLSAAAFGVEIRIVDDGVPFNPLERPAPELEAGVEERRIGGLGIHFAKTLTDNAAYERVDGCNVLRLVMNRRNVKEER